MSPSLRWLLTVTTSRDMYGTRPPSQPRYYRRARSTVTDTSARKTFCPCATILEMEQDSVKSDGYSEVYMAVHCCTLARSLTLPTFQVARDSLFLLQLPCSPIHCWQLCPLSCWPSSVELPDARGFVGTLSGDLPHSTRDLSVY